MLGGSIAGLLAARVLSDHARQVVIIDRDVFPVEPASRPGTPHDKQVHTLLPAGGQWAERWFPGFAQELRERGATVVESDRAGGIYDGRQQAKTGAAGAGPDLWAGRAPACRRSTPRGCCP